ncbi:hypothetical protein C0993_000258, partial [Termitomyces sp. T159_Od127]
TQSAQVETKAFLASAFRSSLKGIDEDTVSVEEIAYCCAFSQKFRIGEDVKTAVGLGIALEDHAHRLGNTAWDGGFFDDDLGGCGNSRDAPCGKLDVARDSMN